FLDKTRESPVAQSLTGSASRLGIKVAFKFCLCMTAEMQSEFHGSCCGGKVRIAHGGGSSPRIPTHSHCARRVRPAWGRFGKGQSGLHFSVQGILSQVQTYQELHLIFSIYILFCAAAMTSG
uniref:Uncharacterized protein n=1 Tax=Xiphophorus maculatus TaxID=8083 RepID=A0A3B5PT23_XIPMA